VILEINLNYSSCACSSGRSAAGIESVPGSVDGMAEALCNACEMVVFWTQSELNPNRSDEGTLEYVDRVSERLSPRATGSSFVFARHV
jgi:phytepsin